MYSGDNIYIFYVQGILNIYKMIRQVLGIRERGQILNIYNVQLFHICDQFLVA